MNRPPLTWPLAATLLLCAFSFVTFSIVALGVVPVLLSMLEMAPEGHVNYAVWMMMAGLCVPPLYCSFSFARILIRRSKFVARLFISVMLALHALGGLLRWEDVGDHVGWYLLSILLYLIPLAGLLMHRKSTAAQES